MWLYGSQTFIVYLNFDCADSAAMTFGAKGFMYKTYLEQI